MKEQTIKDIEGILWDLKNNVGVLPSDKKVATAIADYIDGRKLSEDKYPMYILKDGNVVRPKLSEEKVFLIINDILQNETTNKCKEISQAIHNRLTGE